MAEKKCSKCGAVKDVGEFHRDKKGKYGRCAECKQCKREYYQANREQIAERGREYRQANREQIAERGREYYQANRERFAERRREHYQANREQIEERRRIYQQRRRARKKALPDAFTQSDHNYMMRHFGGQCLSCGTDEQIELDHYIPISKDTEFGTTPENIIPLCRSCNSSKKDKLPDEWLATFDPARRKQIKKTIAAYFKKVAAWQALPMFSYIRNRKHHDSN